MFSIFKKKKVRKPSFYAVIDFSDTAKELCVGGEMNLRIKYFRNGQLVDEEFYTNSRHQQLIEQGIPVVWRAKWSLPIECAKQAEKFISFGYIKYGGKIKNG